MLRFVALAAFTVVSASSAFASMGYFPPRTMEPQNCDMLINQLVGFRGLDNKGNKISHLLEMKNGKLAVNRDNPNFHSVESLKNGGMQVKFKEPFGFMMGSTEMSVTTLTFDQTSNGYEINFDYDPQAVKKVSDAMMNSSVYTGTTFAGSAATVSKNERGCILDQDRMKYRFGDKELETVLHDHKFCKSAEGLLKKNKFEKVDECRNLFKDLGKIYMDRKSELMQQDKAFADVTIEGANSIMTGVPLGSGAFYTAMQALSACSPMDWQQRWANSDYSGLMLPRGEKIQTRQTPTGSTNREVPGPTGR